MSCNWDVRCVECGEDAGLESRYVDVVERIISVSPSLAALSSFAYCDVRLDGVYVYPAFFKEHLGHALCPVDDCGCVRGDEVAAEVACIVGDAT